MKKKKTRIILLTGGLAAAVLIAVVAGFRISSQKRNEIKSQVELGDRYLSELNYEQAVASYKRAWELDGKNQEVGLKLAEAYEGNGMSAYAEQVYNSMLEKDPVNPEICEKLVSLYISQDRYEDARAFMKEVKEKTEDEGLLQLYEETQPEKPLMSYASGEYAERIRVEISSEEEGNILFYTLDGSEPDTDSEIYESGIILPNGRTEVKAIAVNSLGFQSETAQSEYNILIEDEVVEISEPVIEGIIRQERGIPNGDPIYNDDVEMMTALYITGNAVADGGYYHSVSIEKNAYSIDGQSYGGTYGYLATLDDVRLMPFLETVAVVWQEKPDISALASLKNIKNLSLTGNGLTNGDISALSGLDSLERLNLGWNEISDISSLSGLTNLTSLGLWGNQITDIQAVSGLSHLTYLDFSDNRITDITPVQGLAGLEQLWMYHNQISDIAPVAGLEKLTVFMLSDNPVGNPEAVRAIYPHLQRLDTDLLNLGAEEEAE